MRKIRNREITTELHDLAELVDFEREVDPGPLPDHNELTRQALKLSKYGGCIATWRAGAEARLSAGELTLPEEPAHNTVNLFAYKRSADN